MKKTIIRFLCLTLILSSCMFMAIPAMAVPGGLERESLYIPNEGELLRANYYYTVIGNGVRLRSSTDTSSNSNVICYLYYGDVLQYHSYTTGSDGSTWLYVTVMSSINHSSNNGRTGYIKAIYVQYAFSA